MRAAFLAASAGLALCAGPAFAEFTDYQVGAPTLFASWRIGTALRFPPDPGSPDPGTPIYNMDNPAVTPGVAGGVFPNGGADVQSGNTITQLVADDVHTVSYTAGSQITRIYFGMANSNAVSVSARMRLRFWYDNGAGAPGSVFAGQGFGGTLGFTYSPMSFAANSFNIFYFDAGIYGFSLPGTQANLWLGMTFDNNNGATGATIAQMNLLGMMTVSPSPTVGTSSPQIFRTAAAGSFLDVANPDGGAISLAAGTNLAWEIVTDNIPAPNAGAALGTGLLLAGRRQRNRPSRA